ncbi:MAG TPA: DUF5343 domain-containing protein [Dehalococcoidales bacterium]|nr:MAG: hypothetical protein A2Z05_01115 [Chloroflexi bacterium RBG_16_60_22]HJX12269.1 DUF5343 domain-containing protein [Dehalococcoidales bacterium]
MTTGKGHKHLPPYVSYRTFRNFIDRLQQRMPSRIDRSYWSEMLSGSTGTQLMAALKFLGLIDTNGKPAERLSALVAARGEPRTALLREVVSSAFGFVLNGSLDLESATYSQLEEVFHLTFQLTHDVNRKCVKFFTALAGDAGMTLSPFITRRTRSTTRTGTGSRNAAGNDGLRTKRNAVVPQTAKELPNNAAWNSQLLAKFPSFDPSWSDEVKLKWFAAFDELLKRGLLQRGNN